MRWLCSDELLRMEQMNNEWKRALVFLIDSRMSRSLASSKMFFLRMNLFGTSNKADENYLLSLRGILTRDCYSSFWSRMDSHAKLYRINSISSTLAFASIQLLGNPIHCFIWLALLNGCKLDSKRVNRSSLLDNLLCWQAFIELTFLFQPLSGVNYFSIQII